MSYETMTMFVPRIWGYDLQSDQSQVARQAGWSHADILWEAIMEAANAAWIARDIVQAKRHFRRAHWIARLAFPNDDLRHATVWINLGVLAQANSNNRKATMYFEKATLHWDTHATSAISKMTIAPRARSSLFHLRMEALHRDTYHDNFRRRVAKISAEMRAALDDIRQNDRPNCRLYTRWLGERPNVYDDTRIVLAACLLIAVPADV